MADTPAPLVSVAIITYNQEDYIAECIESVLGQAYRPLEIVVADDGSTDNTRVIVSRYAEQHPGVIVPVFAERNGGVTANSTAAHRACTGDYIAWLGGDDVMLPGKIERQVEHMEADPTVALCYHDLDVFVSESGQSLRPFSQTNRPREGGVEAMLRNGPFNGGSATMVRRSQTPDRYDPRILVSSDWLYWSQTLLNGGRILYIPQVLGRYRRHGENVTGTVSIKRDLIVDHMNSAMILMVDHPYYVPEIMWYLGRLFFISHRGSRDWRVLLGPLGVAIAILSPILSLIRAALRITPIRRVAGR